MNSSNITNQSESQLHATRACAQRVNGITHDQAVLITSDGAYEAFKTEKVTAEQDSEYNIYQALALKMNGITHDQAVLITSNGAYEAFKTEKVTAEQASEYNIYQALALKMNVITHDQAILINNWEAYEAFKTEKVTAEQASDEYQGYQSPAPLVSGFITPDVINNWDEYLDFKTSKETASTKKITESLEDAAKLSICKMLNAGHDFPFTETFSSMGSIGYFALSSYEKNLNIYHKLINTGIVSGTAALPGLILDLSMITSSNLLGCDQTD